MKFFGRLKKIRYINKKCRRISVYKLTAQQVDDERTAADMQAHNSCCAVRDSNFSNDIYYLFQQLILYLPTTYAGTFSTSSYIHQHPDPLSRTDGDTSI